VDVEETFRPGEKTLLQSDSPDHRYSVFFEDDGDTGYFYALDPSRSPNMILDAVHIYNVKSVTDRDHTSVVSIRWALKDRKCALLINGYAHAAFDFVAKRGYCRTNFPKFSDPPDGSWLTSDHKWADDAVSWLKSDRQN
jgi:hypothetical protein